MQLYHGSTVIVSQPEIRISRFAKDLGVGFYCTVIKAPAVRWATRFLGVNSYEYTPVNLPLLADRTNHEFQLRPLLSIPRVPCTLLPRRGNPRRVIFACFCCCLIAIAV